MVRLKGFFKKSEFNMNGEPVFRMMDEAFIEKLVELRERFGYPIYINSSYRSKEYCALRGWSTTSAHTEGTAVDIDMYKNGVKRYTEKQEAKLLYLIGKLGFGFVNEPKCYHIDFRDRYAEWGWSK